MRHASELPRDSTPGRDGEKRPARPPEPAVLALQRSAGNQAVARLLARNGRDGPALVAPQPLPGERAESAEAIRQKAIAYWEALVDYHLRWGYFPWERGSRRPAPELEKEVDPERRAADEHAYQQARAQLRAEAEAKPLRTIIGAGVEAAGVSLAWYEQMLTAPQETLMTLGASTPQELCEQLQARDTSTPITPETIDGMTVRQLLERMLAAGTITQSCGQTAGLVHEIVSPSTLNSHRLAVAEDVRRAIAAAAARSAERGVPAYVRVAGGGHAFVIEVHDGVCRIFQSFFGSSTLASDMARDESYAPEQLIAQLTVAMTPNPAKGEPPSDVRAARRNLFMSQAFHPKPGELFQVTEFFQEAGARERLQSRYRQGVADWQASLAGPAKSALKAPEAAKEKPQGELTAKLGDSEAKFTVYGDYVPVSHSALQAGEKYGLNRDGYFVAVKVLTIADGVITYEVLPEEEEEAD